MKSHRGLGVTQTTAWFMLQRMREDLMPNAGAFESPVAVDEAYFCSFKKNKDEWKKTNLERGTVGETAVADMKDRATGNVVAKVIEDMIAASLQGFLQDHTEKGSTVHTDDHGSHTSLNRAHAHGTVKHSVGEYVSGQAQHINDMESFWTVLKHHISPKHLNRYMAQFADKNNLRNRDMDTETVMQQIVAGMIGRRPLYREPVA